MRAEWEKLQEQQRHILRLARGVLVVGLAAGAVAIAIPKIYVVPAILLVTAANGFTIANLLGGLAYKQAALDMKARHSVTTGHREKPLALDDEFCVGSEFFRVVRKDSATRQYLVEKIL